MTQKNTYLALMVAVLLLASVFFTFRLNMVSFWEDESWLAIGMSGSPADLWQHSAELGVHPPLYFYLNYALQPFIGNSELAMRWLSGLVALIGIAWTYRLAAELTDRRTAVFTALFVAGSLFLVYLARLARHYTLFYTLSVMIVWAYCRWRAHGGRWLWVLCLSFAAGLWTHYFSAFVGLTVLLHGAFTLKWRDSLRLLASLVVGGILFSPWLPAIWTQLNAEHGTGLYYGVFTVRDILENYAGRISNAQLGFGIAFAVWGLWAIVQEKRQQLFGLLFIWIVVTFAIIVAVNQTVFVWYIGRNMLYTLPAVALLFAIGMAYLSWQRPLLAIAAVGVFVAYGMAAYPLFWSGTPDWRTTAQRMSADAQVSDTYIVNGEPYSIDYYLWQMLGERPTVQRMTDWLNNPQPSERIWLIDTHQVIDPQLWATLPEGLQLTRWLESEPIVVELWQMPPDAISATFGEQLALGYDGAESLTVQAGDTLVLDVWWQALRTPDFNYSAGFQLVGDNGLAAQQDGNFYSGRWDAQVLPIGDWTPDTRRIEIPANTTAGTYTLWVTVYDWRDGSRLSLNDASDLYPLLQVQVTD